MPTNQREVQRQLMKKYNIFFDGPIDSISNPQWPNTCNTIFQHIRQLGRTDYSQYRESIAADFARSPWKYQVQRRAKRIAEKAKLCIDGRKNESGWRLSLESEVMARFSVEIACRNCRGRLWRSEQEVVSNDQPGDNDSNSLKARQSRRQPCTCNRNSLSHDLQEQGISPLFDDRAEEAIKYSSELQAELPKREDRPDRVYGLQVTDRLFRLLHSTEDKRFISAGGLIGDSIRSSPFKSDGDPIIFPFLVIEAKSEKGSDAFTDTQAQTAFAIRELLSIQHELSQAAGENTEWDAGPLVWFLSYKGEQWRVSAAYIHGQGTRKSYHVLRLWSGGVDSLDNALQLLLIVDYIADWARDIYREGVARSLQNLAAHDSRSLARDDDIFSLAGNVRDWTHNNTDASGVESSKLTEDPLEAFDCDTAVFRDARFIRTRFIGVMITAENLEQFFNTSGTEHEARISTKHLLAVFEDACRVKRHSLDELELLWTGKDRNWSDTSQQDEVFFVVATSAFYLTPSWEQTREMSYIAISESLILDLVKISGIAITFTQVLQRAPMVESLAAFGDLLNRTAEDNLAACVSRLCLFTGPAPRSSGVRFTWRPLSIALTEDSSEPRRGMAIKAGPRSKAREFTYGLYLKHKIGINEPISSIFRVSSSWDQVAKPKDLVGRENLLSKAMWPWKNWASLTHSQENQGLIFAMPEDILSFEAIRLCVFVLDPSVAEVGIRPDQLLLPPNRHFVVRLYEERRGWAKGWNLKNMVREDKASIIKWLGILRDGLDMPVKPMRDPSISKWHLLTTGWNKLPVVDQFELTPNRPFKRQPCYSTLKDILFGSIKPSLSSQQTVHSATSVDGDHVESPITVDEMQKADAQERASNTEFHETIDGQFQTEKDLSATSASHTSSLTGQKRTIEAIGVVDETESSAHASRQAHHQQESALGFSRDFLADEELELILGLGGLA